MLRNTFYVIACLIFLMTLQSVISKNGCEEKETSLISLDVSEDLITKARYLLPQCNDLIRNTSECGMKEKISAHLDMAKKLISEAKEKYPTCIGPKTKDPVTEEPETKDPKEYPKSRDCTELFENGQNVSGVYTIWPNSSLLPNSLPSMQVFCDMDTDGGGWTVIQRRGDFTPQEIFYRDWNDYKVGFGNLTRDFWLGNDHLFVLSHQGEYQIRFDLESAEGEKAYAVYRTFLVKDEEEEYKLYIGGYNGTAGNSMSYHNGMKFSTKDRDNDYSSISCAGESKSGWWFYGCSKCNPNAVYKPGGNSKRPLYWQTWKGNFGLASTAIKIKAI